MSSWTKHAIDMRIRHIRVIDRARVEKIIETIERFGGEFLLVTVKVFSFLTALLISEGIAYAGFFCILFMLTGMELAKILLLTLTSSKEYVLSH